MGLKSILTRRESDTQVVIFFIYLYCFFIEKDWPTVVINTVSIIEYT